MCKKTKRWLVIAAFLVLVGCIIFGGVMTMLNWDFTGLSTGKYETSNYEINEGFKAISINTDTADIVIMPSENAKSSVVCYELKNAKHSVAVKDGTLAIEIIKTGKWYDHIGIHFRKPKVTVYIPQGEYGTLSVKSSTGDVEIPKDFKFESIDILESTGNVVNCASALQSIKIKTSTGNIRVENASSKSLDLSVSTGGITASDLTCEGDVNIHVSTGKTKLTNMKCKSINSSGSTGSISLKNVIAEEKWSIKRTTGNVKFEGSDAAEIFIKTDTGDVAGSLLTDKVYITHTDTGKVDVPKTVTGGRCEITTDTGNIKIAILEG